MMGEENHANPSRCSENARVPAVGQKPSPFHHASDNGVVVAFHQRIQAFRAGSPPSLASRSLR
jgi:hypothetical protein